MTPERIGPLAHRCGLCDGQPRFRLERQGDVAVTWACVDHLTLILLDLLPVDEHRDAATVTDLANVWVPNT
jgi:hypothetical protein